MAGQQKSLVFAISLTFGERRRRLGTIATQTGTRKCDDVKRMDIQTIVVGGGPVTSLIVLKTRTAGRDEEPIQLPIQVGPIEATAISMGIGDEHQGRPLTHDVMARTIRELGATLDAVEIVDVHGTTFYANLLLTAPNGSHVEVDARPSDAIALAVRMDVPLFADEHVLEAAALPDFQGVRREEEEQEMERFHDFVESISPEDFDS